MRLGTLAPALLLTLVTQPSSHAQPPQATQPPATLKVYSRETVVDITVTDAKGNPVHGLKQSDFTVKEDGKPQPIRSFAEYSSQPAPPLPKLPPNVYTNLQPPPASSATNFLLLDFANTAPVVAVSCCGIAGAQAQANAMELQRAMKQEAKKYIQNMPLGTRIGVLGISHPSSLRILQGVTSDPALLSAAIDTLQFDTTATAMGDKETWCIQQEMRNRMTLESLDQIAASLAAIKGRKNLLWFGIGMVSLMDPAQRPPCLSDYTLDLSKAFSALAAAQVTVFPVSSKGVPYPPDPTGDLAEEAEAEAGGGVAFYNTNDIAAAAAKAVAIGSDYYTISYIPPGTEYDGRHHVIKVDTDQANLHLTYRDSYYAEDPSKITPTAGLNFASTTPASGPVDVKAAMGRAMPTSTDLLFDVQVEPNTAPRKPDDPEILGTLDPKLKSEPLTRYIFQYSISAHQIAFTPAPDGTHKGAMELDIAAYDGDGKLLTGLSQTVNMPLDDARYQQFIQGPFRFAQQLDLPAGALFLRIGIFDPTANKLGTLEIPLTVSKGSQPSVATEPSNPASSSTPGQPRYTIKARVPLTILDVVVTDANGHPVHGLKQSDFTVLEDNKEMTPNSFEEHRSDQPRLAAPTVAKLDLGLNSFTNFTPTPPKAGPLNILLLDSLNIPAQGQQVVQRRMLDFLDQLTPGAQVAIFYLSAHLSILQGFTSDRELLKAAITSEIAQPGPPALEDPWPMNWDPSFGIDRQSQLVDREADTAATRAQYELSALEQIARYLYAMPGRKNLIWFTGSFPLQFPPSLDNLAFPPTPGNRITRLLSYNYDAAMKSAADLLARAHVAVYPIDGRGLGLLPLSSSRARSPNNSMPDPATFEERNRNFINIGEHATMDAIAEQTGGKAFYDTNDLTEAAEQAVDSGSNFYAITYAPTNQTLDTRFRAISVKVDQPGLKLTYRNAYYASDPGPTPSGAKAPLTSAVDAALLHGSPEPTQIIFKVKVIPAAATEDVPPTGNQPNPELMRPPYRHYSVWYAAGIGNMVFTPTADGNRQGDFETAITVYNTEGEAVSSATNDVRSNLSPARYAAMLKDGAITRQEIDVPATGEYFLRIVVHDRTGDRVGAVEIPVSSIISETDPAAPK